MVEALPVREKNKLLKIIEEDSSSWLDRELSDIWTERTGEFFNVNPADAYTTELRAAKKRGLIRVVEELLEE